MGEWATRRKGANGHEMRWCPASVGENLVGRKPDLLCPHQKNTRTAFDRAGSVRVYPDSLLAVTFLDGYVVSPILVPDLHQCLAATTFAFGGLNRVAG